MSRKGNDLITFICHPWLVWHINTPANATMQSSNHLARLAHGYQIHASRIYTLAWFSVLFKTRRGCRLLMNVSVAESSCPPLAGVMMRLSSAPESRPRSLSSVIMKTTTWTDNRHPPPDRVRICVSSWFTPSERSNGFWARGDSPLEARPIRHFTREISGELIRKLHSLSRACRNKILINCRLIGTLQDEFNMQVPWRVANMYSRTVPETKYFHRDFSDKFLYEAAGREYFASVESKIFFPYVLIKLRY